MSDISIRADYQAAIQADIAHYEFLAAIMRSVDYALVRLDGKKVNKTFQRAVELVLPPGMSVSYQKLSPDSTPEIAIWGGSIKFDTRITRILPSNAATGGFSFQFYEARYSGMDFQKRADQIKGALPGLEARVVKVKEARLAFEQRVAELGPLARYVVQ